MRKFFYYIVLVSLSFGCVSEESPIDPPLSEFSINVLEGYLQEVEEGWVILNDAEGYPVTFQEIRNGSRVTFEIDPNALYHLTLYRKGILDDFEFSSIATHTFLQLNDEWTLRSGLVFPETPGFDGTFDIFINHTSPMHSLLVMNEHGGIAGNTEVRGNRASARVLNFNVPTDFLISARESTGDIKYEMLPNPESGQTYNYTFNNMRDYDKVLNLSFDEYETLLYSVRTVKEEDGTFQFGNLLNTNSQNGSAPVAEHKIGYLDIFNNFETRVNKRLSNKFHTYMKIGPAPTSINLWDYDNIAPLANKINDFKINQIPGLTRWSAGWVRDVEEGGKFKRVHWSAQGEREGFKIISFPPSFGDPSTILSDFNDLQFNSMAVYQSTVDYASHIKHNYISLPQIYISEERSITQQF